jgi:hypothetical protein
MISDPTGLNTRRLNGFVAPIIWLATKIPATLRPG